MNDRVQRAIADLLNKWRTDPDHYPRHQHDCSNMSEEEVAAVTSLVQGEPGDSVE